MKSLLSLLVLVGLCCCSLGLLSTPSWAAGKPIELNLNSMFPAGSAQHKHLERWADKIKNDSDGRLTIAILAGSVLAPPPQIYDATAKGISDLGFGFPYSPGMPLPHFRPLDIWLAGVADITTAANVYKDLWQEQKFEAYGQQWKDAKILWFVNIGPARLQTVKPVRSLEDLKGMQLRVPTASTGFLVKELGASPVQVSTSELAIALQKGMLDGAVTPDDQLKTFRLADYVHYTTEITIEEPHQSMMWMNRKRYNSLPQDLRKVIDESLAWAEKDCFEMWSETDRAGQEYAKSKGHEFISLTPAEKKKWEARIEDALKKYAAEIDRQGYPATELLQFLRERIRHYSK